MAQNSLPSSPAILIKLQATVCARAVLFVCVLALSSVLSACGGYFADNGDNSSGTYTIGGNLSGLANGQTLSLSLGTEVITRNANGAFTFTKQMAPGAGYEVKLSGLQPAFQTCGISNGVGTVASANVTTVTVRCSATPMGQLNDSGIDLCSENFTTPGTWVNSEVCNAIDWLNNLWGRQQDAFSGRDAQAKAGVLTKVGSGMAGFDFTRIGAGGQTLTKQDGIWSDTGTEAAGTQWDCVRDNLTGLEWEVKRNDTAHLRHKDHIYTWYNPDAATNGGSTGSQSGGVCTGVTNTAQCNTQSYVTAVNAAGLCGKSDWRLPTLDELLNLSHSGRLSPAIDVNHFPNTSINWHWTSSPVANNNILAWIVRFDNGGDGLDYKQSNNKVRLVRSAR